MGSRSPSRRYPRPPSRSSAMTPPPCTPPRVATPRADRADRAERALAATPTSSVPCLVRRVQSAGPSGEFGIQGVQGIHVAIVGGDAAPSSVRRSSAAVRATSPIRSPSAARASQRARSASVVGRNYGTGGMGIRRMRGLTEDATPVEPVFLSDSLRCGESGVDSQVVDEWLEERRKALSPSDLSEASQELLYLDAVGSTLRNMGSTPPPTKEVRMILRLYSDPRMDPREWQETATVSQETPVCYVRRGTRASGAPVFGYDSDVEALEDLGRSFVPGTTDVPPVAAFDQIFEMGRSTAEVARELVPDLLQALWHRRPAVAVPFGQSGSGKTFTLVGTAASEGVVPRLLEAVFTMVRSAVPNPGPPWCCMVQFAQVYKDQRMDLLVDRGDIVFDRLRPWSLLVVKGRKMQLAPARAPPDAGFVVDDAVFVMDEDGEAKGDIKEYKKTLFDLTLQTLKEKLSPRDLIRMQAQRSDPGNFFELLKGMWHQRTPQHTMLEHAVNFLRSRRGGPLGALAVERAGEMSSDLLHFLQLRTQVAKADPSTQVSHVPVDGLGMRRIRSASEFMQCWDRVMRLRVTASTNNNEASSRSAITAKVSLCWPHPAYADASNRIGGPGSYAFSTLTVDDLPGSESAGDFDPSDPNYSVRISETGEIGSDLLKLGLLLGRRTSPSGRKIAEDVRCIDDRQAVVAILLCGKTDHKDLSPTLRFAHHAGRALVASMRQKQMETWLRESKLDMAGLTIADLTEHVKSEAARIGLHPDVQRALVANFGAALHRVKVCDGDLAMKLRTSGALFAALQDLIEVKASEAAIDARKAEVRATEERKARVAAAELEAGNKLMIRRQLRDRAKYAKNFDGRFTAAVTSTEVLRVAAVKKAQALMKALEALTEASAEFQSLEEELLALQGCEPEEFPQISFGLDDLRQLRWHGEQYEAIAESTKRTLNLLEGDGAGAAGSPQEGTH